ncbi:MAG: type II toxin-antitoxin system death-on-curing family toxin [Candidatus Krumholzibacteria bacterium]|nr:type II toxin-antitoxin system death-on-curing family toxin [Candidatus Krumholzibacteria bacterium]
MNQPQIEPTWLSKPALLAIHGLLLAEHGGASGLRDEGLLESAMAGPLNHFQYGETDIYQLAATYAFALTKNHPFIDGNKRTAFAAAGVFLELNGHQLRASEPDAVLAVLALSKGELDAQEFGNWLRISSAELNEGANGSD